MEEIYNNNTTDSGEPVELSGIELKICFYRTGLDRDVTKTLVFRTWEILCILFWHINTGLASLSPLFREPGSSQHGIRTNKSKTNENFANFLTPFGFCFCTTCPWSIASSCTFAILFLQTFFVAKQVWVSLSARSALEFINIGMLTIFTIVWEFLIWNGKLILNVSTVNFLLVCQ